MPWKLLFTQTEYEKPLQSPYGGDWAVSLRDQMLRSVDSPYVMSDDPDEADIIVFWEPHQTAQFTWIPRLRAHPFVREFPNKTFVFSVEDAPLGLLPGLYASLPAWRHHPRRHRAWLYYHLENPYLHARRYSRNVTSPSRLASFSGANSHPLRGRLIARADALARQDILVTETPRFRFASNPNDPRLRPSQLHFIDTILDAKFSLCPRGNGAGSYRLQESMALGRAPVIISDDWVRVAGLDWEKFAVFVAEEDLEHLPSILREREPSWREMGERARMTYETHFREAVFAHRAVEQIVSIYTTRTHDEREFTSQWDRIIHEAEQQLSQGSRP